MLPAGLRAMKKRIDLLQKRSFILPELLVSPCEDVECPCARDSTSCEDLTSCQRYTLTCWSKYDNGMACHYV